ncbi:hypothetical protein FB107DRAFT_275450 [Schizophyllum commune]
MSFIPSIYPPSGFLPPPGTYGAPFFDGSRVRDFIDNLEAQSDHCRLNRDDLPPLVQRYCTEPIRIILSNQAEFKSSTGSSTKTKWDACRAKLIDLFGANDEPPLYSIIDLDNLVSTFRQREPFKSKQEASALHLPFIGIANQLIANGLISTNQARLKFMSALPRETREYVHRRLPDANRVVNNPPTVEAVMALINAKFNPQDILNYTGGDVQPIVSYTDFLPPPAQTRPTVQATREVRFDPIPNVINAPTHPSQQQSQSAQQHTAPTSPSAAAPRPNNDAIEQLTDQLRNLSLSFTQLLQQVQQNPAQIQLAQQQTPPFAQPRSKYCFMCGIPEEELTHPLHPTRCHKTRALVEEGYIKFNSLQNRYELPDGNPLPQLLPSQRMNGGMDAYLRALRTARERPRDAPPHIQQERQTSSLTLSFDDVPVLMGDVVALSSQAQADGFAVTRWGKDTSQRHDPGRGTDNRGRPRGLNTNPFRDYRDGTNTTKPPAPNAPTSMPPPPQAKPPPATPAPPARSAHPPAPHPVNLRDGQQHAKATRNPAHPSNRDKDVDMRDGTKDAQGRQFHFTSDASKGVSLEQVNDAILDQSVTLSLRQVLGISTGIQNKMKNYTSTRREYAAPAGTPSSSSGEIDLFSLGLNNIYETLALEGQTLVIENEVSNSKSYIVRDSDQLDIDDDAELEVYMVRFSNSLENSPRLYAMVCGIFKGTMNGITIIFLVDCGSELNLTSASSADRARLAIDFEGRRWSLKGVNGPSVGLRGCAKDVEIGVGQYRFDHHFFVSNSELGLRHDVILGQPWLQYYAARLDFNRNGQMIMRVWQDGDRTHKPSLEIPLASPGDPRNVEHLAPQMAATTASIEEVMGEGFR